MIASNIDGSNGNGSQLMDLLAVVTANPAEYKSKLTAIQDATNEYKKFVELVGPAAEILTIQKQIAVDKQNADQEVSDAKISAAKLVADAKSKAVDINARAQIVADQTIASAALLADETTALNLTAKENNKALIDATAKAKTAIEAAKQKLEGLDIQLAKVAQAKIEVAAEKSAFLAKHQAFIASL